MWAEAFLGGRLRIGRLGRGRERSGGSGVRGIREQIREFIRTLDLADIDDAEAMGGDGAENLGRVVAHIDERFEGFRNIPAPMMPPMTSIVPSNRPRRRS